MTADPLYVQEIDGTKLKVDTLDQITRDWHLVAFGQGGHALIVNEAHHLRRQLIARLLDVLESLPTRTTVVFTTTKAGQASLFAEYDDAQPLIDRCYVVTLAERGYQDAFVDRAVQIADMEGLNGSPRHVYKRALSEQCKGSLRALINMVDDGRFETAE